MVSEQVYLFFERFVLKMVLSGSDQLMDIGFAASDSIKRNRVFREVNVSANEFMRSSSRHEPLVSHDFHVLFVCRSSNENHFPLQSFVTPSPSGSHHCWNQIRMGVR